MNGLPILKSIERGVLSPVYLLYGKEDFLIRQVLKRLHAALIQEGIGEFNYEKLDGSVAAPARVVDSAGQLPVFADKRLVVVKPAPWFSAARGEERETGEAVLLKYIEDPAPSTCLVMVAGEKIDSRKKLVKAVKKTGQVVEFAALKGSELFRWIENAFRERGKKADRAVMEYLSVAVGNDLTLLSLEIEKVAAFTGDRAKVSLEDVHQTVSYTSSVGIFDLIDTVGSKRGFEAITMLRELVRKGEPELKILSMLAKQLRNMLKIQVLVQRGYREEQIAKEIGLHPYVVRKGMRQCRNFSREELVLGLEALLDADVFGKTGRGEPRALLEIAILKMCSKNLIQE